MKREIYKSENLLYILISQYRVSVIFIISVLIICLSVAGTEFSKNDFAHTSYKDNVKLKLHCPRAPALFQKINTGENKEFKNNSDKNIDQDWYSKAIDNILKDEYSISFSEKTGSYGSANKANDMRFIFHKNGFTAIGRDARRETQDARRETQDARRETQDAKCETSNVSPETGNEWSVDLRVSNINRSPRVAGPTSNETTSPSPLWKSGEQRKALLAESELIVDKNKASIEDENIRIDYTNNEDGMRQDFIIKNRPEGSGKLRLNLSAETKLKMIVGADALMFKDRDGNEKMSYSTLKVFDKNGKELRAYFEKNDQLQITNDKLQIEDQLDQIPNSKSQIPNKINSKSEIPNSKFSIVVDDEDAVYPVTIDPLSGQTWFGRGGMQNAYFGYSVAAAGDVNGDGYGDVIVGASRYGYYSTPGIVGKVFVYHGSPAGLSTTANWTKTGTQFNEQLGTCVSTAGDVNGDGYSDVIISAAFYTNGQSYEGRACVYLGSATGLASSPVWAAEGNQVNANFGYRVSTAGDVNGDGFSDVIVGANFYDNGQTDEGKAFVYYGSSSGLSAASDWTAESNITAGRFGSGVSTAGDVNGDGFSDIIIGAYGCNKAYVYFGSASGLSATEGWAVQEGAINYGWSVSTAGDVNGDGYSDIIVGAPSYQNGQSGEGASFVYFGSAAGVSAIANWTAESDKADAKFGHSVSTAGDINGDGYADVVIGASSFTNVQSGEGRAFAYFGSASGLSSTANWTEGSNQIYSSYGWSVSTAGDVNGDGYSDVIIGANSYDIGSSLNEGIAYVYNGSPGGLALTSEWNAESNQDQANYGYSVSSAGDINGDGYSDVIVGAPYYDNKGKVFVYTGSSTGLSSTPVWTMVINNNGANFGYSVSSAGDVNGDGYSDVIIGSPVYSNGQTWEGAAFVYYGSPSGLMSAPAWSAEGNQNYSNFGLSVSSAGDVNGDGYSDIIVGGSTALLYYGSSAGLSASHVWQGELSDLGIRVSTAGDVNGDGYSDVIVGSYRYGGTGKTFVYHGSSSGLPANANWSAAGSSGSYFGYSVSTAGDVNGDGYSDVLVGAYASKTAFAYYGSASGLSGTPNWTIVNNQNSSDFGFSVSTAGDVNGDGYSDVLVGAIAINKAYFYFGSGAGLSSIENWTASEINTVSSFGYCVSTAGDVNGDGYSDVIIGSIKYSNGNYHGGRASMFYGNSGRGVRANVQQYRPGTNSVVTSGGLTHSNGNVQLNLFAKSPYGRADGKMVYDIKEIGIPFSGINNVGSSGSGQFNDLALGYDSDVNPSGLLYYKEYKWRARVQYSLVNNPYQKFGPWRYYNNYMPLSSVNFRPTDGTLTVKHLNLTMLIQGFYKTDSNSVTPDTVKVYVRNSAAPFNKIDSSKVHISSNGNAVMDFYNVPGNGPYYLQLSHRNSIETWSNVSTFISGSLTYDFSTAAASAYGSNQMQVNTSPVRFAIYNGDVDQDGAIDLNDVLQTYNDANSFASGYVVSDLTGDNFTDLTDVVLGYNNSAAFVNTLRP